jgi:hypothetical protein
MIPKFYWVPTLVIGHQADYVLPETGQQVNKAGRQKDLRNKAKIWLSTA